MNKIKKIIAVAAAIFSIGSISAVVSAYNQPSAHSNSEAVKQTNYANYYFAPTYAKVENKTTVTRRMEAYIKIYEHATDNEIDDLPYASGSGNYNSCVKVNGSKKHPSGINYDYLEIGVIYNGAVAYSGSAESCHCWVGVNTQN